MMNRSLRSGIVAAVNACGGQIETEGVQGSNGISIWGFNMVSTGLSLEKARRYGLDVCAADFEDYQKPRFMNHNEKVKIRIVYRRDNRVIVGAQMASRYDISMGIHLFSLAIQEKVGSANLFLQYDIYHMQIMEGDLARTLQTHLPQINHIQLADNPGRHEPGTGEINYRFLFEHLDRIGYQGWVGCEYKPLTSTEAGLGWLKTHNAV